MENRYIHLGVGVSGIRSYSLGICKTFTSTCLVNSKYRELHKMYVASHVNYVVREFIDNLDILNNPFHIYRSSDRTYYVYKYSDKLWSLLEQIFMFAEFIQSNKKLRYRKREIVENVLLNCRDVDRCIDSIIDTVNRLKFVIMKRRERGKKALLTRFMRNTQKCMYVVDKYFSDLRNVHIFDISNMCKSYYTSECEESIFNVLRKFYDSDIARRYSHEIAAGSSPIWLFARDGIFAIKTLPIYEDLGIFFRVFYDSCVETDKYVAVKLIGVTMANGYIDRIEWIAVLGLDKHSNQLFLHYVPKTLVFRDVETCRRWLLGLADRFGNVAQDIELIEV